MTRVSTRKEPFYTDKNFTPEPTRTPGQQVLAVLKAKRRLLAAVLIPLVVVWLIPFLVAHSPIITWVLNSAGSDLNGTVTARSASLGWFSPVRLGGVEIRDERDQPVLEAPQVSGDRSLLGLLWDSTKLGRFRLHEPKFHVVLRDGGSNVEDLLAKYLASTEPATPRDVDLEIIDGTLSLADSGTGKSWQVEKLQVSLRMPLDKSKPIELAASGKVPEGKSQGQFALELTMGQAAGKEAAAVPGGGMDLKTENLPLAMLSPMAGRLAPKTRLGGRLSSSLVCQWNTAEAPDRVTVQGTAAAEGFTLASAALGSDQIDLARVQANCRLAWQQGRLEVDQLVVESDVGNTSLVGTFQWDSPSRDTLSLLAHQNGEIQGQIDLARLAKMLPTTLRIREGTRITSGQMNLALLSRPGPQGMVWQGRFETSNLTAVRADRQLVWEQPMLITLSARETSQGPMIESLKCESSFLNVNLAGTRDQLTASASFDLNRLASQLNGYIDLGGTRLAGDGWANLTWKRSRQQGGFEADVDMQVRKFQLAIPGKPVWNEDNLIVILTATGRTDFSASSRIDEAIVKLEAGSDVLEARLLQPVAGFHRGGTWAVDLRTQGQIARWMPRLGVWTMLTDWHAAGAYDIQGQVTYAPEGIRVNRGRLAVGQLQVVGPWLNVQEPMAEIVLSGAYDPKARRLEADQISLTTSNVALQSNNLVAAWPAQAAPELSGVVSCQGALEQLQRWFTPANAAPAWQVRGQFAGKAELRQSSGVIATRLETVINQFVLLHQSGRRFQEPQVRLAGRGTYTHQNRTLQIEQADLVAASLGGNTTGRITLADNLTDLQLSGQVSYDLEKLSGLIQSYTGGTVHIVGRGASPVAYRGPLSLAAGQGSASVRWNWAELYGFRLDAAEAQATLAGGVLQLKPLDLQVNEGRLHLAPQVRLNATPVELYLPAGRVIDQVRVNPIMCANALQYVAPVLAGITNIEGRLSLELETCRVPLANPAQSELSGRIILHSAQVGPGPLIQEFALLLGKASPAQLNRESALEFRIVDGRVYHRGLELAFPDLTIRTYGSVGLDQTLAMIAEMPIPPKWRDNRLLAAALKDKILRIPIGGTLQKPKLDRQVLDQISREFLHSAARNVIEDNLNRQFDRLFPQQPRPTR